MVSVLLYALTGMLAGVLSGLVGIGGGIVIVPVLVFLFGFTQIQAQGTSLAMLVLPTGILAVWTYYKAGHVDIRVALILAIGFVVGGLFGAKIANALPDGVLKKVFGFVMLFVAARMIFSK